MVGDFAVTGDIFEAGELVGKHGGDEILRLHALPWRRHFAPATLTRQRQGARRVPTPANGKHRRVQQRLHQYVTHRFAVQITKDFSQRERMLGAERENNRVVRRRRLQLKIERAAEPLAQCQSPRAVHPDAERRVNNQLHPAGLVKEPFHHKFLLRWNNAQRPVSRAEIVGELARAGFGKTGLGHQPVRNSLVLPRSRDRGKG